MSDVVQANLELWCEDLLCIEIAERGCIEKGTDASTNMPSESIKEPRQERSQRTVNDIIEASAHIIESDQDSFSTNEIAKKAGYSIGSLYRFFRSKEAIVEAIAYQQEASVLSKLSLIRDDKRHKDLEEAVRAMIHTGIMAFSKRRRLRRFIIIQIVRLNLHQWAFRRMKVQARAIIEIVRSHGGDRVRPLSEASAFILSRSLMLTIRACIMEENSLIDDPEFEDELVRLALAFTLKESERGILEVRPGPIQTEEIHLVLPQTAPE